MSGSDRPMGMLPIVDRELCFGFGYCAEIAPGVFVVDDEGRSTVLGIDASPADLAAAVEACPRSAIRLRTADLPATRHGATEAEPGASGSWPGTGQGRT